MEYGFPRFIKSYAGIFLGKNRDWVIKFNKLLLYLKMRYGMIKEEIIFDKGKKDH